MRNKQQEGVEGAEVEANILAAYPWRVVSGLIEAIIDVSMP
jgi:hypothetical protein